MIERRTSRMLDAMHERSPELNENDRAMLHEAVEQAQTTRRGWGYELRDGYLWFVMRIIRRERRWSARRFTLRAFLLLLAVTLALVLVSVLPFVIPTGSGIAIEPAFVGLAVLGMATLWIDQRLFPGTPEQSKRSTQCRCRWCDYSLEGLDDAIVFPPEVEDPPSSGPERCPECGRRWPLLV